MHNGILLARVHLARFSALPTPYSLLLWQHTLDSVITYASVPFPSVCGGSNITKPSRRTAREPPKPLTADGECVYESPRPSTSSQMLCTLVLPSPLLCHVARTHAHAHAHAHISTLPWSAVQDIMQEAIHQPLLRSQAATSCSYPEPRATELSTAVEASAQACVQLELSHTKVCLE